MKIEYWTDIEMLRPLVQQWYQEQNGDMFGVEMSVDAFIADVRAWLKIGGTIIVALQDSKPVGFIVVTAAPSCFGAQLWAVEKGWYVCPSSRSVAGLLLYRRARQWSRDNGCSHFITFASNLASDMHDKVCQFYERMGMKLFETAYIMGVE